MRMSRTAAAVALGAVTALSPLAAAPSQAASTTIRAAGSAGYAPPVALIAPGDGVIFENADVLFSHTLTSTERSGGVPLFNAIVGPGGSTAVPGVANLDSGNYAFFCTFHPWMNGVLVVDSAAP